MLVFVLHDCRVLSSEGRRTSQCIAKYENYCFASVMGLFSVDSSLFLIPIALLALYIFYKYWSDPLGRIPTIHWSAPFSRSYIIWQIYRNRRRYVHYDTHMNREGEILPVIRVGPNEISIMTTQGIKIVYDGGFERTSHYTVFQNFG